MLIQLIGMNSETIDASGPAPSASPTGATRAAAPARAAILGLPVPAFLLGLLFVFAVTMLTAGANLADFRAGWIAGQAFAAGRFDLIYPPLEGHYTMRPPTAWPGWLAAEGFRGVVYPFVYPPLWAWAAAQVARFAAFPQVAAAAAVLNGTMVVAMLVMARNLVAPRLDLTLYLFVGLVSLSLSMIGVVSLMESQPQIFVAFLTLVAISRAERGEALLPGTALALAASIKLYPAFLALLFLARGQRRAAAAFALAGAALAALSVAVAGWPLHRHFLALLGEMSGTTLVTHLTYSLESAAAQLLFAGRLDHVPLAVTDPALADIYTLVLFREPAAFQRTFALLQVAAIGAVTLLFQRMSRDRGRPFPLLLWPFALTALALTGPLAWAYYFLAPAAFLPALLDRLPWRVAIPVIAAATCLLSPFAQSVIRVDGQMTLRGMLLLQWVGTATLCAFGLILLWLALRDRTGAAAAGAAPPPAAPPPAEP